MLLKFTAPDMLNTSLVDVATGERAYNIVTALSPPVEQAEESPEAPEQASSYSHSVSSSSSASFLKKSAPAMSPDELKGERRQTTITNASGDILANISWNGRRPDITIADEKVGALTDLFGSSTVRFMCVSSFSTFLLLALTLAKCPRPKILAIPTRFDTEYVWTATPDSLTVRFFHPHSTNKILTRIIVAV